MEIVIKLARIEIKGNLIAWSETDGGFKKYMGNIHFNNDNYTGFLRHDGLVDLHRNNRNFKTVKPDNFIKL